MPVVRNRISRIASGGPRQFAELRDRVAVNVGNIDNFSELSMEADRVGARIKTLQNTPVAFIEPQDRIENVLDNLRQLREDTTKIRQGIDDIENARDAGEEVLEATTATLEATQQFLGNFEALDIVTKANFVKTDADFGPENLRLSPTEMPTLSAAEGKTRDGNLDDIRTGLNISDVWAVTRGENAVVAIFDTGYAEDLIDESRMVGTYHDESVDSVYASSEGHGTMCAGAAAANSEEGVPFDGIAPEAGVILVRITDDQGQIRSDIISEAWDWLINFQTDKPIIANHSYGTPLCSGRPRTSFCDTVENDVLKVANAEDQITSLYAAGNEAMRCGHRLFGFTNGITGTNSLGEVITVGALLTNGREAQRYSSHGRGDCAPIADPKPNFSARIPKFTYYGGEDGWEIKDMSTGPFGSGGGTSHATPSSAGVVTLLQSAAVDRRGGPMETEEVKQILQDTAKPPRRTQINSFGLLIGEKGYDARFGHGEIRPAKAIQRV